MLRDDLTFNVYKRKYYDLELMDVPKSWSFKLVIENAIQIMKDDHYLDYVSNVNKDYDIYREGSYEFHNCLIDNY